MAQINVSNLTFGYEGSYDTIFENVSFSIDTSWKLGFVGRNGKGKTTFLQLLLGKYEYQGAITRSVVFDYFPYPVKQKDLERTAAELMEDWKAGVESWRVLCELEKVDMDAELLYRPFGTLSFGERTRVMLAVLFSGENDFLLIDEPTNHLDQDAREIIKKYLASKKRIYSGIPRQGSAGCLHRSCAGFKPGLDRSTERQFFQLVGKQGKSRSFCQNGT